MAIATTDLPEVAEVSSHISARQLRIRRVVDLIRPNHRRVILRDICEGSIRLSLIFDDLIFETDDAIVEVVVTGVAIQIDHKKITAPTNDVGGDLEA